MFDRRSILGIPFIGIITSDVKIIELVLDSLRSMVGAPRDSYGNVPFDQTDYYRDEMGSNLTRDWYSFKQFLGQDELVRFKILAMEIERQFLNEKGGRKINIDPGLVTLNSVLLTTHKNSGHRIYLGEGIFAEITLIYKNKAFQPLEWTYPDYRIEGVRRYFGELRRQFKDEIRTGEDNV